MKRVRTRSLATQSREAWRLMIGVRVPPRRNTPMLCRDKARLPVATRPATPDMAPDVASGPGEHRNDRRRWGGGNRRGARKIGCADGPAQQGNYPRTRKQKLLQPVDRVGPHVAGKRLMYPQPQT